MKEVVSVSAGRMRGRLMSTMPAGRRPLLEMIVFSSAAGTPSAESGSAR